MATISAHDRHRELVAEATERVGAEGVITLEVRAPDQIEVVEGCSSIALHLPYFVTDAEKMEAVLEDVLNRRLR